MTQVLAAPLNARQMLMAFALYDSGKGIGSVLGRIDFDGVTRRQIYFNTLGRAPERGAVAVDGAQFKPRHATSLALHGEEFQSKLREIALGAFPDKRRLIFVHIPKCAGTDLLTTLQRRFPYLHNHLCLPGVTPKPAMFDQLRQFAQGIALSDAIAVAGHVPLRWYVDRALIRFEDDVFTAVRHPRDIVYSYISFILTRCVEFRDTPRGDTTNWLSQIGLKSLPADASPAELARIGGALLRSRGVTAPNIICHHLGTGTAASALDAMVLTDIELTDMARYSAWRRQKFGFEPGRRINPSQPLFTPDTASAADRAFVDEMIGEDMILYEAIQAKLGAQDGLSIRGRVFG